ncbi:DED1 [Scenedesmus sp. PABB004]|nr:DED1 [Scenedesmus sp. PABB004]
MLLQDFAAARTQLGAQRLQRRRSTAVRASSSSSSAHSPQERPAVAVADGRLPLPAQLEQFANPGKYAARVLRGGEADPAAAAATYAWGRMGLPPADALFVADPEAARAWTKHEWAAGVRTQWPPTFQALLGETSVSMLQPADAELHARLRQVMAPFFTAEAVARAMPAIQATTEAHLARWAQGGAAAGSAAHAGGGVTAYAAARLLTFDILANAALRLGMDGEEVEKFSAVFRTWVDGFMPPAIDLPIFPFGRGMAARKQLEARVRQALGSAVLPRDCLLARLAAEFGADSNVAVDNTINLLFAGHDTTSSAITHLIWQLERHPHVVDRLRAEHAAAVAAHGEALTPEALAALPYSAAVARETLRTAQVVSLVPRTATRELPAHGGGPAVPAGCPFIVALAAMSAADPALRGDPGAFEPERWLDAELARSAAQMPFGHGTHYCVGSQLALAELAAVIASLARRWRVDADVEGLTWSAFPILRPSNGLPLRLTPLQQLERPSHRTTGGSDAGGAPAQQHSAYAPARDQAVAPQPRRPGLLSRPERAAGSGGGGQQPAAAPARARRRVLLDDADARMAAFDALEVATTVPHGVRRPEAATSFNAGPGQVRSVLAANLRALRIQRPTPLQGHMIPAIRAGYDVLAAGPPGAGTSTGALLAAVAQLLRTPRSVPRGRAMPLCLVLCPSRELAGQLGAAAAALAARTQLSVRTATGGAPIAQQKMELRRGADLLIATPGRLLDLLAAKAVSLARLKHLVLEEVDELTGPQLLPATRQLLHHHSLPPPAQRQTVALASAALHQAQLFAAAADVLQPGALAVRAAWPLPQAQQGAAPGGAAGGREQQQQQQQQQQQLEQQLSEQRVQGEQQPLPFGAAPLAALLADPRAALAAAAAAAASAIPPSVAQRFVGVAPQLKPRALLRLLAGGAGAGGGGGLSLVFTNSHTAADEVWAALDAAGVAAGVLHHARSQAQRDEALQCFRYGVTPVLVASGAAARGLDLPDVAAVISYDAPLSVADYARRLGRAGRGGRPGAATTLLTPGDAAAAAGLAAVLRAGGGAPPDWLAALAEGGGGGGSGGGSGGPAPGGGEAPAGGRVRRGGGGEAPGGAALFSVVGGRRRPRLGGYMERRAAAEPEPEQAAAAQEPAEGAAEAQAEGAPREPGAATSSGATRPPRVATDAHVAMAPMAACRRPAAAARPCSARTTLRVFAVAAVRRSAKAVVVEPREGGVLQLQPVQPQVPLPGAPTSSAAAEEERLRLAKRIALEPPPRLDDDAAPPADEVVADEQQAATTAPPEAEPPAAAAAADPLPAVDAALVVMDWARLPDGSEPAHFVMPDPLTLPCEGDAWGDARAAAAAWAAAAAPPAHRDPELPTPLASEDGGDAAAEGAGEGAGGAAGDAAEGDAPAPPADAAAAAAPGAVAVTFRVRASAAWGERVWLVGDAPALGSWDTSRALRLRWSEGDVWRATAEFQAGAALRYKAVLQRGDGTWKWQSGPDFELRVKPGVAPAQHEFKGGGGSGHGVACVLRCAACVAAARGSPAVRFTSEKAASRLAEEAQQQQAQQPEPSYTVVQPTTAPAPRRGAGAAPDEAADKEVRELLRRNAATETLIQVRAVRIEALRAALAARDLTAPGMGGAEPMAEASLDAQLPERLVCDRTGTSGACADFRGAALRSLNASLVALSRAQNVQILAMEAALGAAGAPLPRRTLSSASASLSGSVSGLASGSMGADGSQGSGRGGGGPLPRSLRSGASHRPQQTRPHTLRCAFGVRCVTRPGENVLLVGSHPGLGGWDIDHALPLTWTDGHVWRGEVSCTSSDYYSYHLIAFKAVLQRRDGRLEWQAGREREVLLGSTCGHHVRPCATELDFAGGAEPSALPLNYGEACGCLYDTLYDVDVPEMYGRRRAAAEVDAAVARLRDELQRAGAARPRGVAAVAAEAAAPLAGVFARIMASR